MTDMLRPGKALATPSNVDDPYSDPVPAPGSAAPAGRELDERIAREVMGIVWDEARCRVCGWPLDDGFGLSRVYGCKPGNCSMRPAPKRRADEPAHYSTDIRDAWLVFQHCCGLVFSKRRRFFEAIQDHASIGVDSLVAWPDVLVVVRDRFPELICRAALSLASANRAADPGDRTP